MACALRYLRGGPGEFDTGILGLANAKWALAASRACSPPERALCRPPHIAGAILKLELDVVPIRDVLLRSAHDGIVAWGADASRNNPGWRITCGKSFDQASRSGRK